MASMATFGEILQNSAILGTVEQITGKKVNRLRDLELYNHNRLTILEDVEAWNSPFYAGDKYKPSKRENKSTGGLIF